MVKLRQLTVLFLLGLSSASAVTEWEFLGTISQLSTWEEYLCTSQHPWSSELQVTVYDNQITKISAHLPLRVLPALLAKLREQYTPRVESPVRYLFTGSKANPLNPKKNLEISYLLIRRDDHLQLTLEFPK